MRFERLIIQNYRQFQNVDISFKEDYLRDLSIVVGKNGTGKTNFLNAINWCLYGDEPHLSKDSQQLPRPNLEFSKNSPNNEIKVQVQLEVVINNQSTITFTRTELYRLNKNNNFTLLNSDFTAETTDHLGNNKVFIDDEALKQVSRFVPVNIREYFFFDGERLDKYFTQKSDENILNAIMEISRISILDKMEEHLDKIVKDIQKEAGARNPEVEKTRASLNSLLGKERNLIEEKEEHEKQKDIAEKEKEKIVQRLIELPDIQNQEEQREKLLKRKKEKESRLIKTENIKKGILLEYGKILMLWEAIKNSSNIIDDDKEVPPPIQEEVLLKSIKDTKCEVCGRSLDSHSENFINNLLNEIKFSSQIGAQLSKMINPLRNFKKKAEEFDADIKNINNDIEDIKYDLHDIVKDLDEIERFLGQYDVKKIQELHKERKNFENLINQHERLVGSINNELKQIKKSLKNEEKLLSDQMNEEEELNKIKKELNFASKALYVVVMAKKNIIEDTRLQIESKTKELFFGLLWKKETFNDVKIDDYYNINLIHTLGYECLGSVSAAERELLALSFTLALHEISGFDSPILIDTPLARVSDEHRENFGKIFQSVSKNKQIILLLTPAEYSQEIKELIDNDVNNKFVIKMSSDEGKVEIEGI